MLNIIIPMTPYIWSDSPTALTALRSDGSGDLLRVSLLPTIEKDLIQTKVVVVATQTVALALAI